MVSGIAKVYYSIIITHISTEQRSYQKRLMTLIKKKKIQSLYSSDFYLSDHQLIQNLQDYLEEFLKRENIEITFLIFLS